MKKLFTCLLLIMLSAACVRTECHNSNAIFKKYDPTAQPYKTELAKQLKEHTGELEYYLASYHETESFPYIIADVKGAGLCAKVMVVIEEGDDDIDPIINSKGAGYTGAELVGLKLAITEQPGQTQFIYNGMDFVLD